MHRLSNTLMPLPPALSRRPNMTTATASLRTVESSSQQASWFHPFTYKRFHVLLNSLFKVLCNFPSWYLFAIGLTALFSLRWSLPPTLGCTLKQPDSSMLRLAHQSGNSYGSSTRYGKALVRGTCVAQLTRCTATFTPHLPYAKGERTWR